MNIKSVVSKLNQRAVKKKPHQKEDVDLTIELLRKVKPEKIFAAGDLSDPHGTHRVCLQVIFDAIDALLKAGDAWVKNCEVWLYRGAWQEWGIDEIQMASCPGNIALSF